MIDYKQAYFKELEKTKTEVLNSLNKLKIAYDEIRLCVLRTFVYIGLYYILFTCVYLCKVTYKVSLWVAFLSLCIIILYRFVMQVRKIREYIRFYNNGYEGWCKIADLSDWSRLRRVYYFKNEELTPIIDVINRFYTEFNRRLSPKRVYVKYIYYILLFQLVAFISVVIASFCFLINITIT